MAYSWNGNTSYLNASINAFEMVAKFHVQVRQYLELYIHAGA